MPSLLLLLLLYPFFYHYLHASQPLASGSQHAWSLWVNNMGYNTGLYIACSSPNFGSLRDKFDLIREKITLRVLEKNCSEVFHEALIWDTIFPKVTCLPAYTATKCEDRFGQWRLTWYKKPGQGENQKSGPGQAQPRKMSAFSHGQTGSRLTAAALTEKSIPKSIRDGWVDDSFSHTHVLLRAKMRAKTEKAM